jgi:N-acetylmuramoyl-L-alanine amidase
MRPRSGLRQTHLPRVVLAIGLTIALASCMGSPSPSSSADPSASAPVSAAGSAGIGQVVPAPGSESRIFGPNPGAIVVGIDPGHGGCLDWGVPNPYDNAVDNSEKAITLAVSLALRDWLTADGVGVAMTRETDVALAGDLYPPLGCDGDPFRDVNGDGLSGFGPDVPDHTRTRDELAAHIDLLNLARADVLLSIHVNSFTENGVVVEIAGTETFWTDETPWGVPLSERLATLVQEHVVATLDAVAPYERQDRGIEAVNYYVIAPTSTTGDPAEPRRGSQMPGVLAEVGSMSLEAEADLLVTGEAQAAIAAALGEALVAWFAERGPAARIELVGAAPGLPEVVPGSGPPYWAPGVADVAGLRVRLVNTGLTTWPADVELVFGSETSDEPYLARVQGGAPLPTDVPPLAPGESVELVLDLPAPPGDGRAVGWLTLAMEGVVLADTGNPPLQFALEAP